MATEIPEDLKKRLLAAGVEDEAGLRAALAADTELRAAYEAWIIAMTLQMFAAVPDVDALDDLVARAPILLEDDMIVAIEQAIAQARAAGDETNAQALTQRLAALRAIRDEHRARRQAQPMADALVQFVQAADEIEARAVYATHHKLLGTDDAEAFLINQFEAEDPTARVLLEQRLLLLRTLRRSGSA